MIKILFAYSQTYPELYIGYDPKNLIVRLMTQEYDVNYHMEHLSEYIKNGRVVRHSVVDSIYFLQGGHGD